MEQCYKLYVLTFEPRLIWTTGFSILKSSQHMLNCELGCNQYWTAHIAK